MYKIDVLVQGYPGKSLCHGGLGWSTIALLRGHGRTILIDVGAFSIRPEFARQLKAAECAPESVTDVILTHAHWDHSVNYTLFPNAAVWIGKVEMDWATAQPVGFNPLPELYVADLARHPKLHLLNDGERFLDGFTAHLCPGHTPGCLVYRLEGNEVPVVFSGDAAKNRAEMLSMATDMTMDAGASRAVPRAIMAYKLPNKKEVLSLYFSMVMAGALPEYDAPPKNVRNVTHADLAAMNGVRPAGLESIASTPDGMSTKPAST